VELTILLVENVSLEALLVTSIALAIEWDIVFAKILLLEEPEFTLSPSLLFEIVLLYI
jgi:predicted ATPase